MDLKQISLYKEQIECEIKEEDVDKLSAGGLVCSQYLEGINTSFDICSMWNKDTITANFCYIDTELSRGNKKILYKCSIMLSNGKYLEESSFKTVVVPLMALEQLGDWSPPRKIKVIIEIGVCWATGGDEFDRKNILCDVNDFFPICSSSTIHTTSMNTLLESGYLSDVTLVCRDNKMIYAHKCLLSTSPYFKALFGQHFGKKNQNIVNVEFDRDTMVNLVSFIYSGRVQEEKVCDWKELYLAASFYQTGILIRHSELQLMTRVNREWNCIKRLLKFANMSQALKLKKFLISLTRYLQQTT